MIMNIPIGLLLCKVSALTSLHSSLLECCHLSRIVSNTSVSGTEIASVSVADASMSSWLAKVNVSHWDGWEMLKLMDER